MSVSLSRLLLEQKDISRFSSYGCVLPLFPFLVGYHGVNVSLPDTLIYRGPYLDGWWFTEGDGTLGYRDSKTVDSGTLEEVCLAFTRRASSECGIVAIWMEFNDTGSSKVAAIEKRKKGGGSPQSPSIIPSVEYLTEPGLRERLKVGRSGAQEGSGAILQRFVRPKGPYNNSIRAKWEPTRGAYSMLQITATAPLMDVSRPLYERLETFDASHKRAANPPTSEPLSGQDIPSALRGALQGLADHISRVSRHAARVLLLDTLWRLGDDGKLYFLHPLQVRLEVSREEDRAQALISRITREGVGGVADTTSVGVGGALGESFGRGSGGGGTNHPPLSRTLPATGRLAIQEESIRESSAVGPTGLSVRSRNSDLITEVDRARLKALAEVSKKEAEEERSREEKKRLHLLQSDVKAVKKYFSPSTQCPACGQLFSDVPASTPGGVEHSPPLLPLSAFILFHETVLKAFGLEPYNSSVPSSIWTKGAFDLEAAEALTPTGKNFLPPVQQIKDCVGGGGGFFGSLLMDAPPPPPQGPPWPPPPATPPPCFQGPHTPPGI